MQDFPFSKLIQWHKSHGRHILPWRQYFHLSIKDITYRVWLSEILLQQTQVNRVTTYFEKIIQKYPTVESLASATFEEFFPYYQGLGYYSRARNLLKTAVIISRDFGGIFPDGRKSLESLPGVGPYTAAAILSFAYDKPIIALDTNIQKIFARYYYGDKNPPLPKGLVEALEQQMIHEKISGRVINAALMDFASISVKYEDIKTIEYPLVGCKWYETKGELEAKDMKKSPNFPTKGANIIVILHENHKKYLSESTKTYKPFILPSAGNRDVRHFVQEYFLAHFSLILSVRPVHDKFIKKGIPYIVCNAQIQTGNNQFKEYTKNEVNHFWKEYLQN